MSSAPAPGEHSGLGTIAVAAGTSVASGLPSFLVSSLFIQISASTGAPLAALGAVVATYWVAAAFVSPVAGRVSRRIGSDRLAAVAVVFGVLSLAGTAAFTPGWRWLFVWAVLGGASNALGHPASNHLIGLRVPLRRRALAYGVKQGAVPLSSLAAGAAVPVFALTIGWPWAFAAAAATVALLLPAFRRGDADPGEVTGAPEGLDARQRREMLVIAGFSFLGAGSATAIVTFAVTGAVHRGIEPGTAGLLLSLASLLGGIARIMMGVLADRGIGGSLRTVALMQTTGALGVLLIAWPGTWTFAIGLLVAVGFGWGWPGLVHYSVARMAGPATAAATGITSIGNYAGNAFIPLLFGLFYAGSADEVVWLGVAVTLLLAAAAAFMLDRRGPGRGLRSPP